MTKFTHTILAATILFGSSWVYGQEGEEITPNEKLKSVAHIIGTWEGNGKSKDGKEEAKATFKNTWIQGGKAILSDFRSGWKGQGITLVGWDENAGVVRNTGFFRGRYSLYQVWTVVDGSLIAAENSKTIFVLTVDDKKTLKIKDSSGWTWTLAKRPEETAIKK